MRRAADGAAAEPGRASSAPINDAAGETGVVVCAAGSAPGDLHKLWRAPRPRRQGLPRRVRLLVHGLRDPRRDGRQARRARARGLRPRRRRLLPDAARASSPPRSPRASRSSSSSSTTTATRRSARCRARSARAGFGTHYRRAGERRACRSTTPPGRLAYAAASARRPRRERREPRRARPARRARIDGAARARSTEARRDGGPVVVHIEADRYAGVPGYEGWWDVPVAEVERRRGGARRAREAYERGPQRRSAATSRAP